MYYPSQLPLRIRFSAQSVFTPFHEQKYSNHCNPDWICPCVCWPFSFLCLCVLVAVGPASGSRAINVTQFVVSFPQWVTVILLFIASVIAFQLQDEYEPQMRSGKWGQTKEKQHRDVTCRIDIVYNRFPNSAKVHTHMDKLVNTPCWRYTCKTFVIWEQPSRSGVSVELPTWRWRNSSQRREQTSPADTPMYSGSACGRCKHTFLHITPRSSCIMLHPFILYTYQKGKITSLVNIKRTVNTTNMALAVWCHLA